MPRSNLHAAAQESCLEEPLKAGSTHLEKRPLKGGGGVVSSEVPNWLPHDLAALFTQVLSELPAFPDRRTAADVWTRRVHPWHYRTLEVLPLTTRHLNGRACFVAREFVEYGFRRLMEAPAVRGGRRTEPKNAA
jgi:hypothetical protein